MDGKKEIETGTRIAGMEIMESFSPHPVPRYEKDSTWEMNRINHDTLIKPRVDSILPNFPHKSRWGRLGVAISIFLRILPTLAVSRDESIFRTTKMFFLPILHTITLSFYVTITKGINIRRIIVFWESFNFFSISKLACLFYIYRDVFARTNLKRERFRTFPRFWFRQVNILFLVYFLPFFSIAIFQIPYTFFSFILSNKIRKRIFLRRFCTGHLFICERKILKCSD